MKFRGLLVGSKYISMSDLVKQGQWKWGLSAVPSNKNSLNYNLRDAKEVKLNGNNFRFLRRSRI